MTYDEVIRVALRRHAEQTHGEPVLTPLQVCQSLLERVNAAGLEREATQALYQDLIGHDPFADDPDLTTADANEVLVDYVREMAASMAVHWSLLQLQRLPGHSFDVDGCTYTLAEMLDANRDSPEVCTWVLAAKPGDTYQGMLTCRCVA